MLTFFKFFLRIIGTASLSAILFVYVPHSWMDSIHQLLGMGLLPSGPIVDYLARSTSFFYAIIGGLMWMFSFDLQRFRPVLLYLGYVFILFGLSIFVIDWKQGMPVFWILVEGPADTIFGLVMLYFNHKINVYTKD